MNYELLKKIDNIKSAQVYSKEVVGLTSEGNQFIRVNGADSVHVSKLEGGEELGDYRLLEATPNSMLVYDKYGVHRLDGDLNIIATYPPLTSLYLYKVVTGPFLYGSTWIGEKPGLICYNFEQGEKVWAIETSKLYDVYAINDFCYLWKKDELIIECYEGMTGELRWSKRYIDNSRAAKSDYKALFTDSSIILRFDSNDGSGAIALDLRTGEEIYQLTNYQPLLVQHNIVYGLKYGTEGDKVILLIIDGENRQVVIDINEIVDRHFKYMISGINVTSSHFYFWSIFDAKTIAVNAVSKDVDWEHGMESSGTLTGLVVGNDGDFIMEVSDVGEVFIWERT
ncbi:hypothetical protein SAMN05444266_110167 [Chitinophaga jiangningensis]|uniref:PQQ-like domain-containing protein n=1 Tax=Chitinophaga jiangningensis TaxID=1419482 RepID=A0A1M7L730_9BACT|nr:hypothetical protein [Chitinophaga jiangningensis]SHM73698.1 hypothetical protein SAMN05444266_110167 [Chitinophaga jiangningensis]